MDDGRWELEDGRWEMEDVRSSIFDVYHVVWVFRIVKFGSSGVLGTRVSRSSVSCGVVTMLSHQPTKKLLSASMAVESHKSQKQFKTHQLHTLFFAQCIVLLDSPLSL